MSALARRLREFLERERLAFLAGGRDVVETTRRSVLSVEGRAGMAVFAALWALSRWQAPLLPPFPFDPGPAFARLAAEAFPNLAAFRAALFLLFLAAGASLGVFIRNAWDLAEEVTSVPSRRTWPRRYRWAASTLLVLIVHGGFLLAGMRARPSLYRPSFHDHGGLLRLFQDWLAVGPLSYVGRLWTLLAALLLIAGAYHMGRRFHRWFALFPLPTRAAASALGATAGLFLLGLWGVFRFHLPRNTGPNLVVLAVEGLRTETLKDPVQAPFLSALAQRGRSFAACVPSLPQREAALMTFLSGRSPLVHGVRHGFLSGADAVLDDDSLPARLRAAGATTVAITDAGGGLIRRLAPAFDLVRAPDLSAAGILRRDELRRCAHLLPYLRGPWGRALLPSLRALPEAADPLLLGREGEALLKQLRFEKSFFLFLHFSGGPTEVRAVDRAAARLFKALKRKDLQGTTWVALWSPFAASSGGAAPGADAADPALFQAPFVVVDPAHKSPSRWTASPVQDVDAPPTLLSAMGHPVPEDMRGLPLLAMDASDLVGRDISTETDLWLAPDRNPLPPADRIPQDPPAAWLEEDPEAAGHLRVKPSVDDALLAAKHRALWTGSDKLLYRPTRSVVLWERNGAALVNVKKVKFGRDSDPLKDMKEVFFQSLQSEAGWRPQNDYWIPEAFMREAE